MHHIIHYFTNKDIWSHGLKAQHCENNPTFFLLLFCLNVDALQLHLVLVNVTVLTSVQYLQNSHALQFS